MIRINLLPEKEAKRRRAAERAVPARQISPLTMLVLAAMFGAIGSYYYFGIKKRQSGVQSVARDLRTEGERLDTEIEKRKKSATELQKVESISKSMLDIVYALDPEDRLLWSEKINQLSDLVPANVYVTNLTVTEAIAKKETAGSRRQRSEWQKEQAVKSKGRKTKPSSEGQPAIIYYPEITQALQIQAIAYSENDAERIRLINEFYDNLMKGTNEQAKVKSDFMKGFTSTIEIGDVAPQNVGGRNVAMFSFTLKTKLNAPKDLEEPAAPTAAAAKGGAAAKGEEPSAKPSRKDEGVE